MPAVIRLRAFMGLLPNPYTHPSPLWISRLATARQGSAVSGADSALPANHLMQVMRSYREAQQVADSLSGLGVLLTFSRTWNAAAYKAKCHTVAQMRRDALLLR
jgi:hypothetical protein